MDNGKKNTSKVFSTNDIREEARNWTLAGDVGLLAHLEQFSENIINKTQETQRNFNELMDDCEELYTKVGNVTNQFLALQNCQFVENRVYDEETPVEEKTEVKVQNEEEQEKMLLMQYKEAVEVGIKLLDTHFEEVQLPSNSDSDEEDEVSGNSVIWKPKNPYADKKFPLLIGSAEWWADDHVGLGTDEDNQDTEKTVSESETDMESLKSIDKEMESSNSSSVENIKCVSRKQAFLDSSSEDLFGLNKNENVRKAVSDGLFFKRENSMLEESDSFLPDFEKEPETKPKIDDFQPPEQMGEIENNTPTGQSKKVDNAFTRELMAKLVSVTNKDESEATKILKGSEEEGLPAERPQTGGNLFDETDDSSDLFSAKAKRPTENSLPTKSLFFDGENEDELLSGDNDLFSGSGLFESDVMKRPESERVEGTVSEPSREVQKPPKMEPVSPKKPKTNDLFDDLDDDDTLFAVKPFNSKSLDKSPTSVENGTPEKSQVVTAPGFGWDNEKGLFDSINIRIDDDLFGSSERFHSKSNKMTDSSIESSRKETGIPDLFSEVSKKEAKTKNDFDESSKKESSATETSHLGKKPEVKEITSDPFGFSQFKEHKKISILDSEDDDDDDDDYLFSKDFREDKKPQPKMMTAFPDDEDTALFVEKPKPPDSVSGSSSRSSLFDESSASKSRLASVFEKDKSNKLEEDLFNPADDSLFGRDVKTGKDLFSGKKGKSSLFDDCDDEDDLFGTKKKDSKGKEQLLIKSSVESVKSVEVFEEHRKQVQKVKALTDDLEDDDLFKASGTLTKLRETKSDILRQSESKLFSDDVEDADLFSNKTATSKPKPPNSLSLKGGENESKSKLVGKLNIPDNLKVKFESVARHISAGPRPSTEERKEKENKEQPLDEPSQSSTTLLKCPSKDRVKIPGKRRPQSRRARQEAIRNSGVWDQPSSPKSSQSLVQPSKDSLPSPVVSNPLSPSTDEEDFFKVPELDTNFEKEDQSIFKSDLFESSKSSKPDDNLLFDGAPVLSPLSPKKVEKPEKKLETEALFVVEKTKSVNIFEDEDNDKSNNCDDDDDDESLFKSAKPLSGQHDDKVKKSLFDQDLDDDEDDLFGGKSQAMPPKLPMSMTTSKVETQAKEKKNLSFVDPLGLMTKD